MAQTHSRFSVAEGRIVGTYEIEGRDAGVLTGYAKDGGFFLEHVVAFPGHGFVALLRMLRAAIAEAWSRDYDYVALFVEFEHPQAYKLMKLAVELGFVRYGCDNARAYYVHYRRETHGQEPQDSAAAADAATS